MTFDDLRARWKYETDRIGGIPSIYIDPEAEHSHVLVAEYQQGEDRYLFCAVGRSWAFAEQVMGLMAAARGLNMPVPSLSHTLLT